MWTGWITSQWHWRNPGPLHTHLDQHRRAGLNGNDWTVFINLKELGYLFDDKNVSILDTEPRWLDRGVREAVNVNVKNPSLNTGERFDIIFHLIANNLIIQKTPWFLNNKGIHTTDPLSPGEFPPDRAEEENRMSRETAKHSSIKKSQ